MLVMSQTGFRDVLLFSLNHINLISCALIPWEWQEIESIQPLPWASTKVLTVLTTTGSFGESPMVSSLWCSQWVCSQLKATWDFKGIFVNRRLRGVGVLPLCQTIPPSFFTFCLLLGILPG